MTSSISSSQTLLTIFGRTRSTSAGVTGAPAGPQAPATVLYGNGFAVEETPAVHGADDLRGAVEAERVGKEAVQAVARVSGRVAARVEPPARRRLVERARDLGHRRKAVVGRERDEDGALRVVRLERVEDAPDLEVEPAQRVARLLALVAVVVRDGVVSGERDREEVRDVAPPERVARVVQERESKVGRQDVDEGAAVDAAEVAVRAAGRDAAVRREVVAESRDRGRGAGSAR